MQRRRPQSRHGREVGGSREVAEDGSRPCYCSARERNGSSDVRSGAGASGWWVVVWLDGGVVDGGG